MFRGDLEGDVPAGMGGADHEHRPGLQLVRTAVGTRVQLQDLGRQVGGEGGDVRRPAEGPGGDHDVVAGERVVPEGQRVAAIRPRLEPVHDRVRAHGELEPGRVALQVVGHLVLLRELPGICREGEAREAVVLRRRVEPEGVPLLPPVVADPGVAVQDQALPASPGEVVRRGQAGLAAADDHGLDVLSTHDGLPCV